MADRKITALTELTAPVAADVFPVIDVSESANANKNKKIQLTTILQNIPNGTVSSPSVGFTGDSGLSGFFRVASNEIGISANQSLIGSFTTTGFQLGSGTPAAQLHLFSTDTTDQVIIENSSADADSAPDLVLFRNSASPAADDLLGNLVYRGEDAAGNTHDYASIVASIEDTTNGSEDGILDIMTSAAGTLASRIRLKNNKIGINETDPIYPLHLTTSLTGQALQLQSDADDAASAANLMLYHRRGASGAGQDNDVISTIFYRGKNDAGTPEEIDFAAIEAVIVDASDATEDGKLNLQVMTAGTLTTKLAVDATGINITGTVTDDGAVHDGNVDLNGNIDVSGTSTLNDDVTFTGASANIVFDKSDDALEFADNAKAVFGAGADLTLLHDGTDSKITNITGNLIIEAKASETGIKVIPDGGVEFYHNNSLKFETTSTGCKITGNLTGNDNHGLLLGTGQDFRIRHTGSHSEITDEGTGDLRLGSNRTIIMDAGLSTNQARFVQNGAVELYHSGSKKIETTSSGVTVTGDLTCTGNLDLPDDSDILLGDNDEFRIFHDESNGLNYIQPFNNGPLILKGSSDTLAKFIADGAAELYFDGSKKFETTSSGITVTGTVTETSDIAYKSDIKPITNTLDKIQQITGYKYRLDNSSIDSMGVIAQDVEKVFPELVHGDEGNKTLQYSGLIGVLVEAVKDLSAKVKALESN